MNDTPKTASPFGDQKAAEICGDELMPGVTCQSPKWRCLVQDHGWSDGKRVLTWKNHPKPAGGSV